VRQHNQIIDRARAASARAVTIVRAEYHKASSIHYISPVCDIALGGAWRMTVAGETGAEMLAYQSLGSILMESRYQVRDHRL